jgi:hypothetical protein
MNIQPGRYTTCRPGYTDRIVTSVTPGTVAFYPAEQEARPMETFTADFLAWQEIAQATAP